MNKKVKVAGLAGTRKVIRIMNEASTISQEVFWIRHSERPAIEFGALVRVRA